jgi:pimeloyl-ACP methyl ester carboxylesterase
MWGDKERVVASKYLDLWKADFPNSEFHLVKDWDHFPMLEQVDSFYEEMVQLIDRL